LVVFLRSTQPTSEVFCMLAKTTPVFGFTAMPPQLTPPVPPGSWMVDFGGAPSRW
jgi:hypothetical protein